MEAKKLISKVALLLGLLLVLISCSKPLKPQPPLSIAERKGEAKVESAEILPLTNETKVTKLDREIQMEKLESQEFFRKWERGPLSPVPPPPQPEKKEEELTLDKISLKPELLLGVKTPVHLNVESMPLSDFIMYALGELLKVAYLIDEDVKNMKKPVTLRMPQALPPEDVLKVVVDYLLKQELRVEQRGRVLSITKPKPKPVPPPPPPPAIEAVILEGEVPDTGSTIYYFYPLKFVRPGDIDFLLRDIFRTGVDFRHYPKENAIYFIGPGHLIKRVVEVVKILDIPFFTQKKLYFTKLNYWEPETFVNQISDLLSKLGYPIAKHIKEPGIMFIPLKTLGGVIMAFPDEETQRYVVDWVKRLDTPESAGSEERFYIYRPKYSKAVELASALQSLLAGMGQTQGQGATVTPQPGTPTATIKSPHRLATFTAKGYTISADERRNILLISTTPANYQQIKLLLQELDKPPRQILIEATILELTLKDELKMGLEWYIRNVLSGNYSLIQRVGVPAGTLTYVWRAQSDKLNVILSMLAARGLTRILSTPRLLVLDNQEASIQVGTDVPVVTGEIAPAQATTGNTTGVVRSIQYRSTGIILRVRPTVYAEDLLQLDITQEVSEMGASPPGLNSPTILVRRINSSVVAEHGQSIVLGGLISNTKGEEVSKVPLLGDIPILGHLFRSQSTEDRRTELLILIRPYIIKNMEEAKMITDELKERLEWLKK